MEEDGNTVTVYTAYDAETDTLLNPVRVTTGLSDGTDAEILSACPLGTRTITAMPTRSRIRPFPAANRQRIWKIGWKLSRESCRIEAAADAPPEIRSEEETP